jgi:osmoprotectant transport system ATP-binding protein
MTAPAAIAFEAVSRTYGGRPVLDAISFSIGKGEFLAIVGPSGSGKTTLLRLINRLSEPSSGKVRVGGDDLTTLDPIDLRRRTGYVFQGVGLFPHLTVAENIAITPKLLGWDAARRKARADELLTLVRLDASYGARFPHELSGGERQRIGVARALAAQPAVVLMDEPFSALDALTRDALGEDYRQLHKTLGLTSVMITHDMLEALLLADRIIVLREGRIIADDTPAALMRRDDDPFLRELMQTPRRHAEQLGRFLAGSAP